jgi:hypothetical protein
MKNNVKIMLSVLALAACQAHADLVQNGGFETGDFTDWTTIPAVSGSVFSVATDIPASYGVQVNPHSGNYLAIFGANQGLDDTITQVLPTVAGDKYDFSFWVNNLDGQHASYLTADWGLTQVLSINADSANFDWTEFSFTETALGPTTISFAARNTPSYIGLDDVSVTPVSNGVPDSGPGLVLAAAALFGVCALSQLRPQLCGVSTGTIRYLTEAG